MADNSPCPRAQPEEEYYYRHHVRGIGLYLFYFLSTDSIATSVQQKVLTWTMNSISTNTCSCACSADTFCLTRENTILGK